MKNSPQRRSDERMNLPNEREEMSSKRSVRYLIAGFLLTSIIFWLYPSIPHELAAMILPSSLGTGQMVTPDGYMEAAERGEFEKIPPELLRTEHAMAFLRGGYDSDRGHRIKAVARLPIMGPGLAEQIFDWDNWEALANLPIEHVTDPMIAEAINGLKRSYSIDLQVVGKRQEFWTPARINLVIKKDPYLLDMINPNYWGKEGLQTLVRTYAKNEKRQSVLPRMADRLRECPFWDENLATEIYSPKHYDWLPERLRTWERSLATVESEPVMLSFVPWEQRFREGGRICQIALKKAGPVWSGAVAIAVPDFYKYNWPQATQPERE